MSQLENLLTTDSGHVVKRDAIDWLSSLDKASEQEIRESVVEKPNNFSGSKYATEISDIRVTGSPKFVEAVGSLFKPLLEFEGADSRLEINLQGIEDRDTGELTDNYAL
ncbi:hypothetical protein PNP85_10275 [Halobacterium salinarum]|uniref:hypothetical protein n=1 Tax=Halobacterium salinarum TaxID=2242 RepID=UPI002553365E|nr:hypothetical protein [Halobacterium salinarum]MDL0139889.1 hypothetical protein [Halobacterium salinarum]